MAQSNYPAKIINCFEKRSMSYYEHFFFLKKKKIIKIGLPSFRRNTVDAPGRDITSQLSGAMAC